MSRTSVLLLALLCASTAVPVPPTGRPSRSDRKVPSDAFLPKETEEPQVRKQRQTVGAVETSSEIAPLRPSDWESLAARRRNKTEHSNEATDKETSTPAGKQKNRPADYYYYYFDSFQEAVTSVADFDDLQEGGAPQEVREKQNSTSAIELLTIASWHKSQQKGSGD